MAIRVAGSTFAFGKIDLEESCKIMQEMGFDVVDVGACGMSTFTDYVPQWFITDLDDTQGEADHIRRTTEKYGLEIAELFCCDFGENINDPDPKKREASQQTYEKVAKIAAAAGFNSIMMLPGMIDEDNGQTFDQAFDTSVTEYKRMVDVAEGLGIHCNIEPCIFSVAWQPENAIKLCEAVPGLALTVDYAHQTQLSLKADDIEPLHAYARHYQAKQSAPDSFQAKPDEGWVDFGRMVQKMHDDGFDGFISVEFVSAPEVIEAGWDIRKESARLKEILDDAVAAAQG